MQGFYFLLPFRVRWGISGEVLLPSLSTIHFQDKRLQTSLSGTKVEQKTYLVKEKIHIDADISNFIELLRRPNLSRVLFHCSAQKVR